MGSTDFDEAESEFLEDVAAVQCGDCRSILEADGQQSVSFLLLDQLTIPLISCDDHLEQFSSICELTTDDRADLLHHRPAGGIRCPGCRLAPYNLGQPLIPVQDGAVAVAACPEHQAEMLGRFQTGLQTRQQLSSDIATDHSL